METCLESGNNLKRVLNLQHTQNIFLRLLV